MNIAREQEKTTIIMVITKPITTMTTTTQSLSAIIGIRKM